MSPQTNPPEGSSLEEGDLGLDNPAYLSDPDDQALPSAPSTRPPSLKDVQKEDNIQKREEAGGLDYDQGLELPDKGKKEEVLGGKEDVRPHMKNQIIAAFLVACTHGLIGGMVGLPAVTLSSLTDPLSQDLFLNPAQVALFGSLVHLGAIAGSMASGFANTHLGQRVTLLLAMPSAFILWIGMSLTPSVWLLQFLRVLQGVTMGLVGTASGNYIVEVTHSNLRGRLTGMTDMGRQMGFLLVYAVGSLNLTWREVMIVCGSFTTIPPFIGLLLMPNSPRWLVTRGRQDEAHKALVFFRGSHYNSEAELKSIVQQYNQGSGTKVNTMDQLRKMWEPSVWQRMVFLSFLMVVVQFTGNIPTATYIVPIFQAANTDLDSNTSAILVGCLRVLGTIAFMMAVDHLGRRKLTILPSLACAFTLIALGVYFLLQNLGQDVSNIRWLPLTALLIYSAFVTAAQAATSLLRPELLPTSIRAMGSAILYIFFFLGLFAATQTFPMMIEVIGEHGAFWTYSCCCVLMAVVVAVVLPETKGLSLEQIDDLYRYGKSHDPEGKS